MIFDSRETSNNLREQHQLHLRMRTTLDVGRYLQSACPMLGLFLGG